MNTFGKYFELVQNESVIDKRVALSVHVIFTVYTRENKSLRKREKVKDQALKIQAFLAKEMAK